MKLRNSYHGDSVSIISVLWVVCRAPVLIPVRILIYFIRLIFWPVPTIFRFFYRLVKTVLFPEPLIKAVGPLYFFFFTSISIGIVIGLCFGVASKLLQFILGISQAQKISVPDTQLLENGDRLKSERTTTPINGLREDKIAVLEEAVDVNKLSSITTARRRDAPLTYAMQKSAIKMLDTKEMTPADIVAYNDDRLFETFSSNATPLRYLSSMPIESESSLRQSALMGRHPPTILEEEEEDSNVGQTTRLPDSSIRRSRLRDGYAKLEKRRPLGLTERNLNTTRSLGSQTGRF
ncbi:hypothetical protein V1509DRAFT_631777 [Lipomyces kononenkoae]